MTREQAVNTAARWWTVKLKSKQHHSNGDFSMGSLFACMLADKGMDDLSDDKLIAFETELKKVIDERIECDMIERNWPNIGLGCDYDPSPILSAAAKAVGINRSNFPFKTWMRIQVDATKTNFNVEVSDGYAQPYQSVPAIEEG